MQSILHYQSEHTDDANALDRLEMLLPISARPAKRELQAYVLAFVECYKDDVLQLEHEWELLSTALVQCWQQAEYISVIRLVAALTHSIRRMCTLTEAEQMLRMGIDASRYIQDRQHLATFLNCLGCIYFAHGRYWQGRRLWYEALHLAESSSGFINFWEPLSSFAYAVDILGSYTASHQFAEAIFATNQSDDIESVCVALFVRGLYARLMNDNEQAHSDFSVCLRYLPFHDAISSFASRKLFMLVVQTELARTRGEYARSQQYAESAISLARVFSDHYTVAALLMDQGLYTFTQGQLADTYATVSRLREVAPCIDAPHVSTCNRFLEHHLTKLLPMGQNISSVTSRETLSTREKEVLQLVAEGLSNRDIAQKLVVTHGTVKKHLEHIYSKLYVNSRTSALAKAKILGILYL